MPLLCRAVKCHSLALPGASLPCRRCSYRCHAMLLHFLAVLRLCLAPPCSAVPLPLKAELCVSVPLLRLAHLCLCSAVFGHAMPPRRCALPCHSVAELRFARPFCRVAHQGPAQLFYCYSGQLGATLLLSLRLRRSLRRRANPQCNLFLWIPFPGSMVHQV